MHKNYLKINLIAK